MIFSDLFIPEKKEAIINNQKNLIVILKNNKDLINQDNLEHLISLLSDTNIIKPLLSNELLIYGYDRKLLKYEFSDISLCTEERYFIQKLFFTKESEYLSLTTNDHVLNKLIELFIVTDSKSELFIFFSNFFNNENVIRNIILNPLFLKLKGFLTVDKKLNEKININLSNEVSEVLTTGVTLLSMEKINLKIQELIRFYLFNTATINTINELIKKQEYSKINFELLRVNSEYLQLLRIIRENSNVEEEIISFLESCAIKLKNELNLVYKHLNLENYVSFINEQSHIYSEKKFLDLLNSGTNPLYQKCLNSLKNI